MKFFKSFFPRYMAFFFIGLFAFLFVEIGVMVYINNFYLAENSNYSETKIIKSSAPVKYKNVAISSGYKHAECSYDGHYAAYLQNGEINIADLVSGETNKITNVEGLTVSDFRWLYDSDWLAIAQTSTSTSGSSYVKLYSYDVKAKELTEIRNNNADEDLKIKLSSKSDTVSEIDMSTETGVTYVRITDKNNLSKLYKINSFVGVSQMSDTQTKNIGKIRCLKTVDKLLYENNENGRIYPYGSSSSFIVDGNRSMKLLAVDSTDTAYFAAIKDGKAYAINYGSSEKRTFNTITLDKPVNASDIYVTISGNIYINNTQSLSVTKLQNTVSTSSSPSSASSKSSSSSQSASSKPSSSASSSSSSDDSDATSYKGSVIGVTDSGFIVIYNGSIVHYNFS